MPRPVPSAGRVFPRIGNRMTSEPPRIASELDEFLDSYLYEREGFLIDEVLSLDRERHRIRARMDTTRALPFAALQRTGALHPAHVSAPEILMVTGSLGCLHAWFFHGCRWDEGWVGFGSRVHRADFKSIARVGPALELVSEETRQRVGPKRVVLRYEFRFHQEGRLVYTGDQSAMFFKDLALPGEEPSDRQRA